MMSEGRHQRAARVVSAPADPRELEIERPSRSEKIETAIVTWAQGDAFGVPIQPRHGREKMVDIQIGSVSPDDKQRRIPGVRLQSSHGAA